MARVKPTFEDRVAEYVDSPQMRDRMREGDRLFVTIDGNYGTYRTTLRLEKRGASLQDCECSCPSENWPCKHVHALRETWRRNPGSFDDLAPRWKHLAARPPADLLRLLREIGKVYPQALRYALGLAKAPASEEPKEEE